jgi:Xaa-Pro aminopeptidase
MTRLPLIQQYLLDQRLDGWLVWDFRGSNAVLSQLVTAGTHRTRRAALWIPATGEPVLISSEIDAPQYARAGVRVERYVSWPQLIDRLRTALAGARGVAMEYLPGGLLPVVSVVDAGTVEMIRSFGIEVASSADVIQVAVAAWSDQARRDHDVASAKVGAAKDAAFAMIAQSLAQGRDVTERAVQRMIQDRFRADGLELPDGPIVGVNEHSADPHFEPTDENTRLIRRGDWVLIDLWARVPGDQNVYADITWVGFAGDRVPDEHAKVFHVVRAGRDAALAAATEGWRRRRDVLGCDLDDACRTVIETAGFGHAILHRTGHSLSPGPKVHGVGMNLDNLETRDTRRMLPGVGFTIEPGIYLQRFGVRSEINVHVHPEHGPQVTSGIQDEPLVLLT